MFKPCAIKEITNLVQAKVVRVGGNFDAIAPNHVDFWMEGLAMTIRWWGAPNLDIQEKNWHVYSETVYDGVGGVLDLTGGINHFGWLILRNCQYAWLKYQGIKQIEYP